MDPISTKFASDQIDVTQTTPYQLPVNMVFQSYALFPHMTVFSNVAFELRRAGLPRRHIRERVQEMLDLVQLSDCSQRKPHALSGGQR